MEDEPVEKEQAKTEEVQIGRIGGAYGLKGWVKVFSFTDPIDQILSYLPWQLRKGRQVLDVEIEQCRTQGKGLVALVEGFSDRNQAESIVGYEIWIDRSRLPDLDQGDYYWHQLEGLEVFAHSGELFGQVEYLMETGSNDVLVVKPTLTSVDDKERLIPFVEGEVVKNIDLESARITVDWNIDY